MRNNELDKVLSEIDKLKNWSRMQNRNILIEKILELNEDLDYIANHQEIDKIKILSPLLKYFSFYIHPNTLKNIQPLTQQMQRSTLKVIIPKKNVLAVILEILKYKNLYRVNWEDGNPYQVNTSIYFDNSKFECYTQRIKKLDNSWVFRLREYEDIKKILMIEFKNHRKYTDSTKARDFIKESDINSIVEGNFDSANLNYNLIREHKLKPYILTSYKRFYFQENENSNLRITLDLDIIGKRILKHNNNDKFVYDDDQYKFPDAVMEIKFQNCKLSEIEWLQKLIDSNLVDNNNDKSKYSKFISSMWYFYGDKYHLIKPKWQ